jgi:phosphoglycerol transferase
VAAWLQSRRRRLDAVAGAVVALVIALEWSAAYRLFEDQRLTDPVSYFGDAHFSAAVVAAAMRGDFLPFASKELPSLGAPFVANWNDFPMSEDWLFFLVGTAARVLGVFGAINLSFLFACVLAGLSLFLVARRLHLAREFSLMAGVLYGLSMYAFARGTHHFSLTFFWIIPWNVLVAAWASSREGVALRSRRFPIAAATVLLTSWSMVYYALFAAHLLGLAFALHVARRGRRARFGAMAALVAVLMLGLLATNADTLLCAWRHGSNLGVVGRAPSDVERFALKPVNFFTAAGNHRFEPMRQLSALQSRQSLTSGEAPAPYLGVVGCALLLGMVLHVIVAFGRRRLDTGAVWGVTVAWLVVAHSVGGETSLLGLAGLSALRSVNRVSIVILAYVLLFGAWALPRLLRRVPSAARWALALVVAIVGAWEPIPVVSSALSVAREHDLAESDRTLVGAAEVALPQGALVFQLPAMHFPEVPAYGGVDAYEQFRPYFFARHLRFSHGDIKGRPNSEWKIRTAALPPQRMVAELRGQGFAAIYINLKGYGSGRIVDDLVTAGATVLAVAPAGDSLFLRL